MELEEFNPQSTIGVEEKEKILILLLKRHTNYLPFTSMSTLI